MNLKKRTEVIRVLGVPEENKSKHFNMEDEKEYFERVINSFNKKHFPNRVANYDRENDTVTISLFYDNGEHYKDMVESRYQFLSGLRCCGSEFLESEE